jgi:hypothetical protein
VIDRILTGLRNQGPGAIPALILSLLALGGTAYWLLSENDDGGGQTQTSEVVSAPSPLAPASSPSQVTPPVPSTSGSGSSSGGGDRSDSGRGGNEASGPTTPVAPTPSGSGSGADTPASTPNGQSSNGGGGQEGNGPTTLEDLQQLLQHPPKPDRHRDDNGGLPGLQNLLENGSGSNSGGQPLTAAAIQDLLENGNGQK